MKAGLVGEGIGGSLTPEMHEMEGREQGLDFRYVRFDTAIDKRSLSQIVDEAEAEGFAGLNVTHPHKREACQLVDELRGVAETLGAINTIVFENGRRVGYNTDYIGFRSALRRDMAGALIKHVLLVGAGGAGAAVALAIADQGATQLTIHDRQTELAENVAGFVAKARPHVEVRVAKSTQDIDFNIVNGVVNATPMGMESHPGTAIDVKQVSRETWVSDIVYFPLETTLLARARMRGCRVMDGSGMAVFQAVASFNLFTGLKADSSRMADSFHKILGRNAPMEKAIAI